MSIKKFTIGIDFGTDSVRALVVDASNGAEAGNAVFYYPRWKAGKYCDAASNRFRQHPADYLEGLENSVKQALAGVPDEVRRNVAAISVDTTGSTPVAVNREGVPLSLTPGFEEDPDAMFILWKDHTAVAEAEEINLLAHKDGKVDYTKYEGGVYSSEWFWAKILHVLRTNSKVRDAAFSWVEHCDWIPAVLTGITDPLSMVRSRCAAGHKAMWHEDFNGLPSEEFLTDLDPLLSGLRSRLYKDTYECNHPAGTITKEWSRRLGLPENVIIGAGSFDAHLGAIGAEIEPYYMTKVMGTSTCDMLIAPLEEFSGKLIGGICGQVDGSIIPGMLGLEAGQSAFGDVYAWFKNLLMWPLDNLLNTGLSSDKEIMEKIRCEISAAIIPALSEAAAKISPDDSVPLALDWMNGRRTPYANQMLKGAITGITLGTEAPAIFRSLVEATAFGTRAILERFMDEGIEIKGIIALGGVAKKSPFVMQTVCNVLNMPIKVVRSEQTCALGSAMAASVVARIHPDLQSAQSAMGGGFEGEYRPDSSMAGIYGKLYNKYKELGRFVEKTLT
jgi:L-ribulokinase